MGGPQAHGKLKTLPGEHFQSHGNRASVQNCAVSKYFRPRQTRSLSRCRESSQESLATISNGLLSAALLRLTFVN
jgi:hypothetical protein